ncbi:hypothetical protein [Streptomyces aidingensis]|uniref:Uncharacterized protein n=1 Tax=Streptomyces aidingensis TaxID=910347 RepID=A0A1I1RKK3_9ACTN|nr:hypothetical protein [Streptomyces aidingensis]SFD34875.1 hypothetical protein SAMN05421773_113154 [Streptomyces aidingensis]
MNVPACTTDGHAEAARRARDLLLDMFGVVGVAAPVRLVGDAGRLRVDIAPLAVEDAAAVGNLMLTGAMAHRITLEPGAAVWSVRHGQVCTVTRVDRRRVTLRSALTGEELFTVPNDLRAAHMSEILWAQQRAQQRDQQRERRLRAE